MNGIAIEEVLEALSTAKDEINAVDNANDDIKSAAGDVKEAADSMNDAVYEAEQAVRNAIDLIEGWQQDQKEGIKADDVQSFLQNSLSIVDQINNTTTILRSNLFQFARDLGLDLRGE